jgi:hypothetical protein
MKRITKEVLRGSPGLRKGALCALVERQPKTVLEALKLRDVGRKTTKHLLELGLIEDPEGAQNRSLAKVESSLGRKR